MFLQKPTQRQQTGKYKVDPQGFHIFWSDLIDSSRLISDTNTESPYTFFPGFLKSLWCHKGTNPCGTARLLCQEAKTWTNSLQCSLIKLHRSCLPGKISVGRECVSKGTCPWLCALYCHTTANILWEFHGVDDKLYYRAPSNRHSTSAGYCSSQFY